MYFLKFMQVLVDDDNEEYDIHECYAESASQVHLKLCSARNDITTALPLTCLILNVHR